MNDPRRRPAAKETMCWLTCAGLVSRWLAVREARALNDGVFDAANPLRLVNTSSPRGKLQSLFKFSRRCTRKVQTGIAAEKLSILLKGAQHSSKRIIPGTGLRITLETQSLRAGEYLFPPGHSTFDTAER